MEIASHDEYFWHGSDISLCMSGEQKLLTSLYSPVDVRLDLIGFGRDIRLRHFDCTALLAQTLPHFIQI